MPARAIFMRAAAAARASATRLPHLLSRPPDVVNGVYQGLFCGPARWQTSPNQTSWAFRGAQGISQQESGAAEYLMGWPGAATWGTRGGRDNRCGRNAGVSQPA